MKKWQRKVMKIKKYVCLLAALCCLLFCQLLFCAGGVAQSRVESGTFGGNSHSIYGVIRLPSGEKPQRNLMVRLIATGSTLADGGSAIIISSDANGSFVFRDLTAGTYRIAVDAGKEYEPTNETIYIKPSPSGGGTKYNVEIQLRGKKAASSRVVDASLIGIPQPALDLYGEALKAKQKSDVKKAIELLNSAISLHAEFMLAYNELGLIYMRANQPDEAEKAFQAALKLTSRFCPVLFNHGLLLTQRKQFDAAETELRRAVACDESSAPSHLYLGRVLVTLQKYDEAEKHLLRAVSLGGESLALAHRFLGALYLEQSKKEQGIKELETYLKLEPNAKDAQRLRDTIKQLRNQP